MKKFLSRYSTFKYINSKNYFIDDNLMYTYNYQTKDTILYKNNLNQTFYDYFKTNKVQFKNLKEFKQALYNYSQHINQEIKFKHISTSYLENNYIITKINNIMINNWKINHYNNWTINLEIKDNYENKYCLIMKNHLFFQIYITQEAENIINPIKDNLILETKKMQLKSHNNENYHRQIMIRAKTRNQVISTMKTLEELLEIKL